MQNRKRGSSANTSMNTHALQRQFNKICILLSRPLNTVFALTHLCYSLDVTEVTKLRRIKWSVKYMIERMTDMINAHRILAGENNMRYKMKIVGYI
jgi:hypothetical protein